MESNQKIIHTKQSLCEDLKKSGIHPTGTLFVHSSVKAVGPCENRADTILDAFIEFMSKGLLVLPAHTWNTINGENNIFDPLNEPSCVGVLSNLFLKRPGVIRSLHPTHSVAAIGRDGGDYVSGEEHTITPCPRNGCYGKLYDRRAQILFLGCNLTKNTFLHGVEEWNRVPQRLAQIPQELYIKTEKGLLPCPQHRHYSPTGHGISRNYNKMEQAFIQAGAAQYCKIGDAHSILCDAVKMADLVGKYLKKDPNLFLTDQPVEEFLQEKSRGCK